MLRMNQCDGCLRDLPKDEHGNHTEAGHPVIGCTAHLYAPALPIPSALAGIPYDPASLREICASLLRTAAKTTNTHERGELMDAAAILRALADTIEKTEGKP